MATIIKTLRKQLHLTYKLQKNPTQICTGNTTPRGNGLENVSRVEPGSNKFQYKNQPGKGLKQTPTRTLPTPAGGQQGAGG